MSLICAVLVGFAFFCLFNTIFGGSPTNNISTDNTDKDIERLREIADYERWEKAGRGNSRNDLGDNK